MLVESVEQLAGRSEKRYRIAVCVATILQSGEVGKPFRGDIAEFLRIAGKRRVAGNELLVRLEQRWVSAYGGEVASQNQRDLGGRRLHAAFRDGFEIVLSPRVGFLAPVPWIDLCKFRAAQEECEAYYRSDCQAD